MIAKRITEVNGPLNTFAIEFGKRLREERERRALNQAEFSALGGVAKITQLYYEKGYRVPDARYLSNLHKHGVDVVYLLSGQREMPNGERLDGKLLSSAMTAVLHGLAKHGYMLDSEDEGLALVRVVYDTLLNLGNTGLTTEQIVTPLLKGWFIGRGGRD